VRPGANKFAFNYDLPYDGRAVEFRTRRAYGVQQLAVMVPQAMKFTSASESFALLAAGNPKYRVEATKELRAGRGPAFEISGSGELAPLGEQQQENTAAESDTASRARKAAPGSPSATAKSSVDAAMKSWRGRFGLAAIGALLAATIGWMVWTRRRSERAQISSASTEQPGRQKKAVLDALVRELARLDRDKSRGTISADDYAATREALEKARQGALARTS
jgi:hypothetical protein